MLKLVDVLTTTFNLCTTNKPAFILWISIVRLEEGPRKYLQYTVQTISEMSLRVIINFLQIFQFFAKNYKVAPKIRYYRHECMLNDPILQNLVP